MAAIIGALRAELSASIAQWQDDMGKAAESLKGFQRTAQSVSKGLDKVGTSMALAITAPLALLAKAGLDEAKQAREAMGQVEAALESTGNAGGRTAAQLKEAAGVLQNLSTFDDDDILRGVTANLLTFGNVQGEVFDRAQKSVVNLASRLGGDLQGAAIKVGRALNDPIKGMTALSRIGISFTSEQQKLIKNLVQSGQGFQAQNIILAELEKRFGGAAEAMRKAQPDAVLTQSWRDFKETIGAIELQLLPALTEKLQAVVSWFNNLTPATQKFVVQAAALLAVVGPLLVIFSKLLTAVVTILPYVITLGKWIAGLSAATLGWVAALAAVVLAIFIFWDSVKKVLKGDFAGAWESAKDTAKKIAGQITGIFKSVEGPKMPGDQKAGVKGPTAKPGKLDFNLANEDQIKKAVDARKALDKSLAQLGQKLDQGFDAINLPKATTQANALNVQLDEYIARAKEAGVNTKAFDDRVAGLRKRIGELEAVGLAKEAEEFGRAVDKTGIAVKRFAAGSLDPLSEKIETIDTAFESLRDEIVKQIADNAALAGSNDNAARAMERLQLQLGQLEEAHAAASAAARTQFQAEEMLADLQTKRANLETKNQIRDLQAAAGKGGPVSSMQAELQAAQDELARKQIDTAATLVQLTEKRDQAALQGHDTEVARLETEITLQQQLADLVSTTTADQIVAGERLNSAFQNFTDDLADSLSDMIVTWRGDLDSILDIGRQLAKEVFLKPLLSEASAGLGGALKGLASSLFAGGFAKGGYIPPGQWGIVGEKGPEPVFGGKTGADVRPNGGGGVTQVFNISTPDANSFRLSQRQIGRVAKSRLAFS
jgi:hypothetical protein